MIAEASSLSRPVRQGLLAAYGRFYRIEGAELCAAVNANMLSTHLSVEQCYAGRLTDGIPGPTTAEHILGCIHVYRPNIKHRLSDEYFNLSRNSVLDR